MRKISRDFLRMSPKDVAVYGKVVEGKMTVESGIFTNPTPPISTLATTREALEVAYTSAEDGGLVQRQERDTLEATYKQQLLQLADYVAMQVSNDEELMERSGFELTKVKEKVGPLPMVAGLKKSYPALSGALNMRWKVLRGAYAYVIQHKEYGTEEWTSTNVSRASTTISSLVPQKKYVFRVAGVGAAGQGPWSDEITAIAI